MYIQMQNDYQRRMRVVMDHLMMSKDTKGHHKYEYNDVYQKDGNLFMNVTHASSEEDPNMLPSQLPGSFKQVVVTRKSSNFREAAKVVQVPLKMPKKSQILVKNYFAGCQASDIMISNGVYGPLRTQKPPMVAGTEACGVIVAVGDDVPSHLKVGQTVVFSSFGTGFTEYALVESRIAVPLPIPPCPEPVSIIVSGLTAALAFQENGIDLLNGDDQNQINGSKIMLVTAASGATGSFAVQLAKIAGFHVIGTCGGEEKVKLLKKLGCDRIVNYKVEKLDEIMKKEYPKGVHYVYEGVGGEMFHTCLKHLAPYGKMIVIGMITDYKGGPSTRHQNLSSTMSQLLFGNKTISGFFLINSISKNPKLAKKMIQYLFSSWLQEKKLMIPVDQSVQFKGVESSFDAVDYLHSGKNIGKVFIAL